MKADRRWILLLLSFVWGQSLNGQAADPEGFRLPLAGRLVGGPSATPDGGLLLPCEDETLTWMDSQGKVQAVWSSKERFAGWAAVGPEGICVVPLLSGRVVALRRSGQHSLRPFAQTSRPALSAFEPVLGAGGRWLLGWKDGWVSVWNPVSGQKNDVPLGEAPLAALYDPNYGFWIRTSKTFTLVREDGSLSRWPLPRNSRTGGEHFLAQGSLGALWSAGPEGLLCFQPDLGKIYVVPGLGFPLSGVAVGADDGPVVLGQNAVFFLDRSGQVKTQLALPATASSGPILDNRGGVYVYTERGLAFGRADGRLLRFWSTPFGGTPPLLTSEGDLVWVASDWNLRLVPRQAPPYLTWSQPGGDPQHSGMSHRGADFQNRLRAWQGDSDYQVLAALLKDGTRPSQEKALSILEEQQNEGDLMVKWPFANLVLLALARSGVTDVRLDQGRILNDWPDLRLRAYKILESTATPEDKNELLDLVGREYEGSVQNEGVVALARTGLDPDGSTTDFLRRLRLTRPDDASLASALLDAAQRIWDVNGPDSPPGLPVLVGELYRGDYPHSLRVRAEKLFQKMISSP